MRVVSAALTQEFDTTSQSFALDVTNHSTSLTVYVSQVNAITGRSPEVSVALTKASQALFIAAGDTNYATATTTFATVPTSTQVGDLMLLNIMARQTLTAPSGWTLVRSIAAADGTTPTPITQTQYLYSKVAAATDLNTTVTVTQATSDRIGAHIDVFRNASVISSTSASQATTGTQTFTATVPGTSASFVYASVSTTQASTGTGTMAFTPTGWNLNTPASLSATNRMGVGYSGNPAIGSVTATTNSLASGAAWVAVLAQIR